MEGSGVRLDLALRVFALPLTTPAGHFFFYFSDSADEIPYVRLKNSNNLQQSNDDQISVK